MCGSRCGARVEANEIARRALQPRHSAAVGSRLAVVERMFPSPWSPTHIVYCADRSDYVSGDFQADQAMPSELHSAWSASRACALA